MNGVLASRSKEKVIAEQVDETLHGPARFRGRRGAGRRQTRRLTQQRRTAQRARQVLIVVEPSVEARLVEDVRAVPELPNAVPCPHLAQAHRARRDPLRRHPGERAVG